MDVFNYHVLPNITILTVLEKEVVLQFLYFSLGPFL